MYTMVTAHSGCDGTPDNSMEFVAHALTCGADALEVDVRARSDGSFYLSHDVTDRECPDLEAVFRLMQGSSMKINCDLKEPGLELGVLSLARKTGMEDRLLFSGEVSTELMARNEAVRARTLLNIRPLLGKVTPAEMEARLEELVAGCRGCGAEIINVSYEMCTDTVLERLQCAGIGVSAWTVNKEDVARRLLSRQIYNITSRTPGMVLALRDDR